MMEHPAAVTARQLAGHAERLCRRYLSNGRREGNYWLVGDVRNTPGRSLYVRLCDRADGTGRAGKWTDAESGEHGDLLDIIRASGTTGTLAEALTEAQRFLSLPDSVRTAGTSASRKTKSGSPEAARRLLAISSSIANTPVEVYLHGRGLPTMPGLDALHFHPRCFYRRSTDDRGDVPTAMPAMIAAVSDIAGNVTGAHRTWLTADGTGKACVAYPRRAMGYLLGHGVRFGTAAPVMAAGEGIESTLSLYAAVRTLPSIAALSSAHLAALAFTPWLRRLYVAREADPAGRKAFATLTSRASQFGIDVVPLDSRFGDLNTDLRAIGLEAMRTHILAQMRAEDRP